MKLHRSTWGSMGAATMIAAVTFAMGISSALANASTQTSPVTPMGKGPVGLQALDDRYAVVADSALDALVVIDTTLGGMVGHILLHSSLDNPDTRTQGNGGVHSDVFDYWMDPIDVATCPHCDYAIVTSRKKNLIYHIDLMGHTWNDMAKKQDFSPLKEVSFETNIHPIIANVSDYIDPTSSDAENVFEKVVLTRNKDQAYVCHATKGVYRFNPIDSPDLVMFLPIEKLDGVDRIFSCKLSVDEKFLFVTSSDTFTITEIGTVNNPSKPLMSYALQVGDACSHDGMTLRFSDYQTVVTKNGREYLYALGYRSTSTDGNTTDAEPAINPNEQDGMALYMLALEKKTEDAESGIKSCDRIAGDVTEPLSWVDGNGDAIRFSRSNALASLSSTLIIEEHIRLLISDTDNRALRLLTMPVEDVETTTSATIVYDEDLWHALYFDGLEGPVEDRDFTFFLPSAYNSSTHDATTLEDACIQSDPHGRLCTVQEYRKYLEAFSFSDSNGVVGLWARDLCSGCVLEGPGYCESEVTSPQIAKRASIDSGAWGLDHHIFVSISVNDDNMKHMNTECVHEDTVQYSVPFCCVDLQEAPPPTQDEGAEEKKDKIVENREVGSSNDGLFQPGVGTDSVSDDAQDGNGGGATNTPPGDNNSSNNDRSPIRTTANDGKKSGGGKVVIVIICVLAVAAAALFVAKKKGLLERRTQTVVSFPEITEQHSLA